MVGGGLEGESSADLIQFYHLGGPVGPLEFVDIITVGWQFRHPMGKAGHYLSWLPPSSVGLSV